MPVGRDQDEPGALVVDIADFSGFLRAQEIKVRFFEDFHFIHGTIPRPRGRHSRMKMPMRLRPAHIAANRLVLATPLSPFAPADAGPQPLPNRTAFNGDKAWIPASAGTNG